MMLVRVLGLVSNDTLGFGVTTNTTDKVDQECTNFSGRAHPRHLGLALPALSTFIIHLVR